MPGIRLLLCALCVFWLLPTVLPASAASPDPSRLVAPQVISTTPPAYDKVRYEASLMLQDYLKVLGLDVSVKVQDLKVLMQKIRMSPFDFDLYVKGWGSTTDRIDPHNFLFNMLSCTQAKEKGLNRQGYCDPEYQKLVEAAEVTMHPEARREKLFKAQEYVAENVAIFPFVFDNELQPYNKTRIASLESQGGVGIFNYNSMTGAEIAKGQPILKVAQRQGNDILNPMALTLYTDRQVIDLIYDYLARLDVNNEAKPSIAESWKVADDTTVEVKIRSGLTFHDGQPLTAEDVKFTFDYGQKWSFGRLDSYIKPIEKVELVDKDTVRFLLKEPTGYLITGAFVSVPILPKHIWENIVETKSLATPHDWAIDTPIGSGPFKFEYWRRGEELKLDTFKAYYKPIKFDGIILKPYANPDAILNALELGETDMTAERISPLAAERLRTLPDIEINETVSIGFEMMGFNTRRPPWNDVAMRKAAAYAINLADISDVATAGYKPPAGAGRVISPSNKFWYNPDVATYEYNVEKARDLLKQAGYEWDKKGRLYYPAK